MKRNVITRLLAYILLFATVLSMVPATAVYAVTEDAQEEIIVIDEGAETPETESIQEKSVETRALDGWTVYYQTATGHYFPVKYRSGMSVGRGSSFNAADLNEENVYVVPRGPASVSSDGVTIIVDDDATINSTIYVDLKRKDQIIGVYSFVVTNEGDGYFAAGLGTEERPYLIENATQFKNIGKKPSAYYMLISDINLGGMAPISSFSGVLDGCGYTLYNWKYEYNANYNMGLFWEIKGGATVKNLILSNCELTPKDGKYGQVFVGILCGTNSGTIENVRVVGGKVKGDMGKRDEKYSVSCYTYVGGICGRNWSVIRKSGVTGTTVHAYAGNNENDKTVSGCAGGIAGFAEVNAVFENVYAYDNKITAEAKGDTWWVIFVGTKGAYCYARAGGIAGCCSGTVTMTNVLGYNNDLYLTREGKSGNAFSGSLVGCKDNGTLTIKNGYSENEDGNHVGSGSPTSSSSVKKLPYLCLPNVIDDLTGFSRNIWVQNGSACPKTGHPAGRTHLVIAQVEQVSVTSLQYAFEIKRPLNLNKIIPYSVIYDSTFQSSITIKTKGYTKSDQILRGYTISDYDPTKEGVQTITITYGKASGTTTVRFKPHEHTPGPAATCTTKQYCTVCDAPIGDLIPHSDEVTKVVAPGCEENGYTVYTCSVCGYVHNDSFTDPVGHQLDSGYTCTLCGKQFPVPLKEYTVYVYDAETTMPVEKALVSIGDKSVRTNAAGAATFQLAPDTEAVLKITKDEYPDYENKEFVLGDMPSTYIYIASDESGIYEAWCNGDNVLLVDSQINSYSPILEAEIVVAGRAKANITKYEIVQDGQVIASSTDGTFKIRNPYFKENVPVYARMHTDGKSNNVFERELNISVVDFSYSLELDDIFPFAAGVNVDFTDGVPLLNGVSFQIPAYGLGEDGFFNFTAHNEKAIFTFGMEKDFFEEDLDVKSAKEIMRALKDKIKQQNNYKAWPKGKATNEVSLSGALVLEFGKAAEVTAAYGEIHVGYELSYKWGKTFVVWVVPIYAGFKAGFEGELVMTEFGYDFENSEIMIPDLDVTLSAEIAAYGGLGCSIVSAGVYGAVGGELNMGVKDFQEYLAYRLYGELGVYARLDLFFWKEIEYRIPLLCGEFTGPNGQVKKSILSLENYETASRSYLENRSQWMEGSLVPKRGEDATRTLQTSSYTAIEPRIVVSGDTVMMLFLNDDGSEGFNYQHLYYSLFNKETNTWGTPVRVDDSEYADLEYDVYADNSGIYLAYTKAGNITAENQEDYAAIMAGVEVYTAQYDPADQCFTGHSNVSQNDCFDSQPQIINGAVVWVNNFTNDGLAQNANNVLMLTQKAGNTWQKAVALDDHGATVTSIDLGVLEGKTYLAIIRDVDCDLFTTTDRRLELMDLDGNVTVVTSTSGNEIMEEMYDENGELYYLSEGDLSIEAVRFDCIDGQNVIQWCGDENIWQLSAVNGTPVSLLEEPEQGLTGEFKMVRIDEDKTMILYAKNSVEDQIAGSSIYAVYYADGQWGKPVPLTETTAEVYVDAFDGCAYDGKLLTAYISTQAAITEDDITRTSNFMTSCMEIKDDLAVGEVVFLESELVEGSTIDLKVPVTNQSWQKLNNVTVQVQNSQGTAMYTQSVQLETPLGSGQSEYVTVTLPKENLSSTEQYQVYVSTPDWTDDNISNNAIDLPLWYTDFEVAAQQMLHAGKQQIHYAVTNSGNTAGTGTLWIYKKQGNEEIELHREPISLGVGKTHTAMVEITDKFYTDENGGVVYAEIKPDVAEVYNFNNSQSLTLTTVKKTTTDAVSDSEQAIPAPVVNEPYVIYDKHAGGDVSVKVTENGWSFTGVKELEKSQYSYSGGKLQLQQAFLQSLSVGYHYYNLSYSLNGKTSDVKLILEITNSGPAPAALTVQDVTVTYDGAPVKLSELGYITPSKGTATTRYNAGSGWINGMPTEMGEYTVELTLAEDTENNYGAVTAQFKLTVIKGTRAISVPTYIAKENGRIRFSGAIPTAAATDGKIYYGYSTQNDAATVSQWSETGILPQTDKHTMYYVFAKITGGTKYGDAVSKDYAVDAHVHQYEDTVVPPTTAAEGYTLHTCKTCGENYKDNFVEKLKYIRGDVNDDGYVNSNDVLYFLRFTLSPGRYPINQSGDMNGDGYVNSNDVLYLLRHILSPGRYPLHE